jgi:hypothetical protein
VLLCSAGAGAANLGEGKVGASLYARAECLTSFSGSLTVTFATPGERLVVAYGRKYRKLRQSRSKTSEAERELFKPVRALMQDGGRRAIFAHLQPDYYDLVVVDETRMTLSEGLQLLRTGRPLRNDETSLAEIRQSLGPAVKGKIGGWEAFFDTKEFNRLESDGERAGVFLQQTRQKKALAESGAVLQGCIHSVDICWLERALKEGVGWQVVTRQQLYRAELPDKQFFQHVYSPRLGQVRVGTRPKTLNLD